jgi:hypothetical protein
MVFASLVTRYLLTCDLSSYLGNVSISQTILSGWPDGMTGLALSLTEHTVDLTGLAVLLL